jgi:hypothetical protein
VERFGDFIRDIWGLLVGKVLCVPPPATASALCEGINGGEGPGWVAWSVAAASKAGQL